MKETAPCASRTRLLNSSSIRQGLVEIVSLLLLRCVDFVHNHSARQLSNLGVFKHSLLSHLSPIYI